jgi:hypothetical protein
MTCAGKLICSIATLLVAFTLTAAPAKAQFGGFGAGGTAGGGQDMMTQMAPMLEMMKAKMGKKRFAALMQTMGPMMSQMMQGGGGGFGSLGGGFGGGIPGGFGGGGFAPEAGGMSSGAGFDVGSIMSMVGPMMQMANLGGGAGHHRRHRHK